MASFSPESDSLAQEAVSDTATFGPQHLSDLTELLIPYAHKWRFIGIALKFQPQDLDNIQASPLLLLDSPKSYLIRLLEDWLMRKLKHTLPPTRKNLERALNSETVGLGILCAKLQGMSIACEDTGR